MSDEPPTTPSPESAGPEPAGAHQGGLHQIGTVEDRVGLSQRTIRHYDEIGLVIPSGRSAGGFRLYTDDDIDRLLHIKAMKPLGFTLEESGALLAVRDELAAGRSIPEDTIATLLRSAERAEERLVKLERQLRESRALTEVMWEEIETARQRLEPDAR